MNIRHWVIICYFLALLFQASTVRLYTSNDTDNQVLFNTLLLVLGIIFSLIMAWDIRNKGKRILSINYWVGFLCWGFITYIQLTYSSPIMSLPDISTILFISGATAGIIFYLFTAYVLWMVRRLKNP